MVDPVSSKNDFVDQFIKFFSDNPRDLFRAINNIFFSNKHLIGRETKAIAKGLKNFSRAADVFSFGDFIVNGNKWRHYFTNTMTEKEDIPMLISDTANNVAESTAWISTTGLISLSAYASSWVTSMSGITLMISFSKRSVQSILELKKPHNNEPKKLEKRNIAMCNLAKNISFFAIGFILFTSGWFGFALNIAAITISSSVAIISSFASFYIENRNENDKKAKENLTLNPSQVNISTNQTDEVIA